MGLNLGRKRVKPVLEPGGELGAELSGDVGLERVEAWGGAWGRACVGNEAELGGKHGGKLGTELGVGLGAKLAGELGRSLG